MSKVELVVVGPSAADIEQERNHGLLHPEVQADMEPRDYVSMVCIYCDDLGPHRCAGCGAARYCSTACQAADWPVHRRVCRQWREGGFARPRAPRSPVSGGMVQRQLFRAIFFRHDRDEPAFIWVRQGLNALIVEHPSLAEYLVLRARRPSAARDGGSEHVGSATSCPPEMINELVWEVQHRNLDHGLILWNLGRDSDGLEWANRSIMSLVPAGHSLLRFGPVVVVAMVPSEPGTLEIRLADVTMRDFRHTVDYLQICLGTCVIDRGRFNQDTIEAIKYVCGADIALYAAAYGKSDAASPSEYVTAPLSTRGFDANIPCKWAFAVGLRWYMRPVDALTHRDADPDNRCRPVEHFRRLQRGLRVKFQDDSEARLASGDVPDHVDTIVPYVNGSFLFFHASGRRLYMDHVEALDKFVELIEEFGYMRIQESDFRGFWNVFKDWRSAEDRPVDPDVPSPYHLEDMGYPSILLPEENDAGHGADQVKACMDKWRKNHVLAPKSGLTWFCLHSQPCEDSERQKTKDQTKEKKKTEQKKKK